MRFIYLHGFCSGPTTFKGNYFRQRFDKLGIELITPDLNGGDFSHLTLSSQIDIAKQTMGSSDEPVTLIGSSMGGYIAALLAQELPLVERTILIAPAFRFLNRFIDLIGQDAHRTWRESGWMEIEHFQYGGLHPLHYGIVKDAQKYEQVPLDREVPTQTFHGLYDDTVPYSTSIDYLRGNAVAELVLFPSDHSLNSEIDAMWDYMASRIGFSELLELS